MRFMFACQLGCAFIPCYSGINSCEVNVIITRCCLHSNGFQAHSIIVSKWIDHISPADVTSSKNASRISLLV